MSEEEIIDILKEINIVDFYNTYTDSTTDFSEPRKYCDAIQGLLDLYNNEKDKINLKIEEYEEILQSSIIKEDYKKEVEHIIRVLEELKGE